MTENTLIRSEPCPECRAEMLWTQNAWRTGDTTNAAYQCVNGHVLDPATTRQCPACGLHDTTLLDESDGRQQYRCLRCGSAFQVPR
jgi:Zn ribbon nucleic-acid-binding protein